MSPRAPWETGKTTSLTAVDTRGERGRDRRARSRATHAAASRIKLQPVARRGEARGQMLCSPCPRRPVPSSCHFSLLRGGRRPHRCDTHMHAIPMQARMPWRPRLVGGTMRACRAQRQHPRALPPTLPRPRHGSCARRRTEGVAAAEPLNRFPSRLGECTAPSAPAVHSHFAFELPCRPEAAREPSRADSLFSRKSYPL